MVAVDSPLAGQSQKMFRRATARVLREKQLEEGGGGRDWRVTREESNSTAHQPSPRARSSLKMATVPNPPPTLAADTRSQAYLRTTLAIHFNKTHDSYGLTLIYRFALRAR